MMHAGCRLSAIAGMRFCSQGALALRASRPLAATLAGGHDHGPEDAITPFYLEVSYLGGVIAGGLPIFAPRAIIGLND
jgi:hypothetical protein